MGRQRRQHPYAAGSRPVRGWKHKFVCLSSKTATTVPTGAEKQVLYEAGLGEKTISLPCNATPAQLYQQLLQEFPQLSDAGGYDLLKCIPGTKRLIVIPVPQQGHDTNSLQSAVDQGRIFIRPCQRELDTKTTLTRTAEQVN